ncbi:9901_t:CDS:1, partial [Gigaspora margarita]
LGVANWIKLLEGLKDLILRETTVVLESNRIERCCSNLVRFWFLYL